MIETERKKLLAAEMDFWRSDTQSWREKNRNMRALRRIEVKKLDTENRELRILRWVAEKHLKTRNPKLVQN